MTGQTAEDGTDIIGAGEDGPIIRAKWAMDGAKTLAEAAAKLRELAAEIDKLHEAGWTLQEPIDDDYAFLVPPAGS